MLPKPRINEACYLESDGRIFGGWVGGPFLNNVARGRMKSFWGQIRGAGVGRVEPENVVSPPWPCFSTYSRQHRLLPGAHRVPILPVRELRVGR